MQWTYLGGNGLGASYGGFRLLGTRYAQDEIEREYSARGKVIMGDKKKVLLTALMVLLAAQFAADAEGKSPLDELPSHIRRVTHFGQRADFSHDGKRILFVEKTFGDVYEVDMETEIIRPMTHHYFHEGYTRGLYLSNGDILLSGARQFDATNPWASRSDKNAELWVLKKDLSAPPVALGEKCSEGPAVSRKRMQIVWTQGGEFYSGGIVYEDGKPKLTKKKKVLAKKDLPFQCNLETQNLRPPGDKELIFSAYGYQGTEVCGLNLRTGRIVNYSMAPDQYDEPEGIFPDGKHTLVECDKHSGKGVQHIDLYKLALDGSGRTERVTFFSDYPGYKASNPAISDDGRYIAFQVAKQGDPAGVGRGILIFDIEKSEEQSNGDEEVQVEEKKEQPKAGADEAEKPKVGKEVEEAKSDEPKVDEEAEGVEVDKEIEEAKVDEGVAEPKVGKEVEEAKAEEPKVGKEVEKPKVEKEVEEAKAEEPKVEKEVEKLVVVEQAEDEPYTIEGRIERIKRNCGVKVHHKYDAQAFFPARWLAPPISGQGSQMPDDEVERVVGVVEKFVRAYPKEVLEKNLTDIYLISGMKFYGKGFGAAYGKSALYVNNEGRAKGYTQEFLLSQMHSELSSILLVNYRGKFPTDAWKAANARGWKYRGTGVEMLGQKDIFGQTEELLSRGFLVKYSQSSLENDLNMFAFWGFTKGEELRELASKYVRISEKYRLVVQFYRDIDPEMNIAAEPETSSLVNRAPDAALRQSGG